MAKHLFIMGHGDSDPGASGSGTNERDFLRDYFMPALRKYAPKNIDFHHKDNFYQRRHAPKITGYDEITEFHLDWAKGASGGHVIIYDQYEPDKIDLAIRDTIRDHVGLRSGNGIDKRSNLYNLNVFANRGITYRLVELGFINNENDMDYIRDNINAYAKDMVDAITGNKSTKPKKISKPAPSAERSEPSINLVVDGQWGNATSEALQMALDTVVDGKLSDQLRNAVTNALYGNTVDFGRGTKGSMVIKALQRLVGAKVDGLLGPQTVRLLQTYLGTVKDGVLSRPSLVVEEMQRKLNAGTFAA